MPVLRLPYPHSDSTGSFSAPFLPRRRAFPAVSGALLLGGALLLAGCGKEQPKAPEVRPVRTMTVVSEQAAGTVEFSGDVRPRVESRLGFRVPGKIIARLVDVGATVRKGQVLARLDPTDLALAQQSAQAQLQAAKTDRDLAASDLKRFPNCSPRASSARPSSSATRPITMRPRRATTRRRQATATSPTRRPMPRWRPTPMAW